jgi:anti-sigma regulatory factor (Ser/Thr protein kinase)
MADVIDFSLIADAAALARIEAAVEAFSEHHALSPKTAYALSLVIEELVTNIVKYGYAGGPPGPLTMTVGMQGGSVVGALSDAGVAFDPTAMATPDVDADVDERHIGGLGVHLVRTLADEFAYRREDGRNIITFRLPAG